VNKMTLLIGAAVAYLVLIKGKTATLEAPKAAGTPTEGVTAQVLGAAGNAAAGATAEMLSAIGLE
jgi:hypothetical protein